MEESVLFLRDNNHASWEIMQGIHTELEETFTVREFIARNEITEKHLRRKLDRVSPTIIILIGTHAAELYKDYQQHRLSMMTPPPSIVLGTDAIYRKVTMLNNATGIIYEVPIITGIINLRHLLNYPVSKVGIVHREHMTEFINENIPYCTQEGVTIRSCRVPETAAGNPDEVRRCLTRLLDGSDLEALWIPNDTMLTDSSMIFNAWKPMVAKLDIPTVVGNEELVNANDDIGTLAVYPDNTAYGFQAAELVFEIQSNNWRIDSPSAQPSLSVFTVANCFRLEGEHNIPGSSVGAFGNFRCSDDFNK